MTSRVFLPQYPVMRNPNGAQPRWIPKYDLSPAESFGELVACLPVGNIPSDVGTMTRAMEDALRDFDPALDYLVGVGDPFAIALAMLIVGRRFGSIRLLKWDRDARVYRPHSVSPG